MNETAPQPRLLKRILVRVEAANYLIGGILLATVSRIPATDPDKTGVQYTMLEVIKSRPAILGLAIFVIAVGALALWAVNSPKRIKYLEYIIFAFFLVRLYAFLGSIADASDITDTRWLQQLPWVIVWSSVWLILRAKVRPE